MIIYKWFSENSRPLNWNRVKKKPKSEEKCQKVFKKPGEILIQTTLQEVLTPWKQSVNQKGDDDRGVFSAAFYIWFAKSLNGLLVPSSWAPLTPQLPDNTPGSSGWVSSSASSQTRQRFLSIKRYNHVKTIKGSYNLQLNTWNGCLTAVLNEAFSRRGVRFRRGGQRVHGEHRWILGRWEFSLGNL